MKLTIVTILIALAAGVTGCGGESDAAGGGDIPWQELTYEGRAPDATGHIPDLASSSGTPEDTAFILFGDYKNYGGDPDNYSVQPCTTAPRGVGSTLPPDVIAVTACGISGIFTANVVFALHEDGSADYAIWDS